MATPQPTSKGVAMACHSTATHSQALTTDARRGSGVLKTTLIFSEISSERVSSRSAIGRAAPWVMPRRPWPKIHKPTRLKGAYDGCFPPAGAIGALRQCYYRILFNYKECAADML